MTQSGLIEEVVLITTTDLAGGRREEVARLFESLERVRLRFPGLKFRHYFLVQRCCDPALAVSALGIPAWVTLSTVDRQISLSAARNRMIDALLQSGVSDDALVGFPDDDAWYADGTLDHVIGRFSDEPLLDFWFCRYGSGPAFDPHCPPRSPGYQEVLSHASSNTIMVRGRVAKAIGGFDEALGLGTPTNSGEDTDYAIRAYFAARRTSFVPAVMIGHRDYPAALRNKYYPGATLVIARYSTRSAAAFVALCRKIAVGAVLVVRRELPLQTYVSVLFALRANR